MSQKHSQIRKTVQLDQTLTAVTLLEAALIKFVHAAAGVAGTLSVTILA